jgi:hypothetical protein
MAGAGTMTRALSAVALLFSLSLAPLGCDEKPPPAPAAAVNPSTPARAAETPKPNPAPPAAVVLVDDLGPLVGNERIDVNAKDWVTRLQAAAAKLSVANKTVEASATRTATTQHVGALVGALGGAGAAAIDLKTPGRNGPNAILKLTPERLAASPADCSAVALVKKDSTSAVWRLKGGVAAKFAKGFAGPDLSTTLDGLRKQIDGCSSSTWFFAGDDNVIWGLTFDLGMSVAAAEPKTKATVNVLLHEAPVAGRPVRITP